MGQDVFYDPVPRAELSQEEIAMIEAAQKLPYMEDEENPEIDPVKTPELYAAAKRAVAERNRRIAKRPRESA